MNLSDGHNDDRTLQLSTGEELPALQTSTDDGARLLMPLSPLGVENDLSSNFRDAEQSDAPGRLIWPDSEALLQSILNCNFSSWPQNFDALPSQYLFEESDHVQAEQQSPWLLPSTIQETGGGTYAVKNISQILSDLAANVTSEAESTTLNSIFLEACLHIFFEQFTPSFPICHRPTFVFRDWTHPVLLNSIALGSLFVGQDINIVKGEVLWTLAHTAVATTWHSLIQHRGPYDSCNGVQLLLTALLGQTYAMMSGTAKLRSTAQIFHSLGFYWARQCGMYNFSRQLDISDILASESVQQLEDVWRAWAAREVQLRALLGHYVLDGLLTYFAEAPTCQRHALNSLPLSCSQKLFSAASAPEWASMFAEETVAPMTFRQVLVILIEHPANASALLPKMSLLTIQVVMEGMQSLVTDSNLVGEAVVGSPSRSQITKALELLSDYVSCSNRLTESEKTILQLRWHTICIDTACDFTRLCKSLCLQFDTQQSIFAKHKDDEHQIDLKEWTKEPGARRALIHSVRIWQLSKELTVGQLGAVHVPISLFVAAAVYSAFVLSGTSTTQLPYIHRWRPVLHEALEDAVDTTSPEDLQVFQFVSGVSATNKMITRNLLYDITHFALLLKQNKRPWRICADFEGILQQWLAKYDI